MLLHSWLVSFNRRPKSHVVRLRPRGVQAAFSVTPAAVENLERRLLLTVDVSVNGGLNSNASKFFPFFVDNDDALGTTNNASDLGHSFQFQGKSANGNSSVHHRPQLYNVESTPYAYKTTSPAVPVTSSLQIRDDDSASLTGATVRFTKGFQAGEDILSFAGKGKIAGVWNAATGVLTLAGSDSVSNYRTALHSVTYANTSLNPNTELAREVAFVVNDGNSTNNSSNLVTRSIIVSPPNLTPTLSGVGGTPLTGTDSSHAAVIAPTIVVSGTDSTDLFRATVQISRNYVIGQDRLNFVNRPDIQSSWNAATGTLTLTGKATSAAYQSALRTVTCQCRNNNPSMPSRTIAFVVNDGFADSKLLTQEVSFTSARKPTLMSNVETTPLAFLKGSPVVSLTSSLLFGDTDRDNLSSVQIVLGANYQIGHDLLSFVNTAKIIGIWKATTGTLTLSGTDTVSNYLAALRTVKFVNTSSYPTPLIRTATVQIVRA